MTAANYQQKDIFQEVLLNLVGINFRNYGILIDPGHRRINAGDVFDVDNM